MSNQLDFLTKDDILKALKKIDREGLQYDEEVEYYIKRNDSIYPFKYSVAVASTFTKTPIKIGDFKSEDSTRKFIASLGFHIVYRDPKVKKGQPRYWVGASYFDLPPNQKNMFDDFIKNKYWRTDHDLEDGTGARIYELLEQVKINDRLCIRYIDKKNGRIQIAAIGTVTDISDIDDGSLGVIWDYNPPAYKGLKPAGHGSGNWWLTLFELKKHEFIETVFGEKLIERRVSRLAWNDNGWVMPSGTNGKSKDRKSHENRYGYGHEEWLFDTSKVINGYHYGFLEPVRKEQQAYANKVYDVWLYTIYGETKQRFWIGEIKNLIVIEPDEAKEVYDEYVRLGWHKEMEGQIRGAVGDDNGFSEWLGIDLLNVKFKPSDLLENDVYVELPEDHEIYEQSRYAFAHFREEYEVESEAIEGVFTFGTSTGADSKVGNTPKTGKYIRKPKAIEIVYYHKAISDSLAKTLKAIYGKDNVVKENNTGYMGNRIDIAVNDKGKFIFYEIKTYNSIKTSIREALGQLLEYCFYPNKCNARELVIVTHRPADKNTQLYFKHLREMLKVSIYYQSYDLKTETLSDKC